MRHKPPLRCRFGFHWLLEGNCLRCRYRWHGDHAEPWRSWLLPDRPIDITITLTRKEAEALLKRGYPLTGKVLGDPLGYLEDAFNKLRAALQTLKQGEGDE